MQPIEVIFAVDDVECAGWFYPPSPSNTASPCVVMGHGFSLTRHDGLARYAETLSSTGAAVLIYEHRHLGDSGGRPRQLINVATQLQDRRAAIEFARKQDGVDPERIFTWGYSLSGGSAVVAAATDHRIAGAILLCPMLDGQARVMTSLRADPLHIAWLLGSAAKARITGGLIPICAQPRQRAVFNLPGEADGFKAAVGAGSPWRNEISPRYFTTWGRYRPITFAPRLACPVFVQLGERDISAPAAAIEKLARHAPRAELKRYNVDHFEPFSPRITSLADDQAAWLARTIESETNTSAKRPTP